MKNKIKRIFASAIAVSVVFCYSGIAMAAQCNHSKVHNLTLEAGTHIQNGEKEVIVAEQKGSFTCIDCEELDINSPLIYTIEDKTYSTPIVQHGNGNNNGVGQHEYWAEESTDITPEPPVIKPAPETEEHPQPPVEIKDAHFFVRVDKVVQYEDGNTHYEAKNYFPIGTVSNGYVYGSNISDYNSVDGSVDNIAHIDNSIQSVVTEEIKTSANEEIYPHILTKPTIEDVITAAKNYSTACNLKIDFENIDVLWYVIKTEGDKIHVDGVLYNKETGDVIQTEDLPTDTPESTPIITPTPTPTPEPEEEEPVIEEDPNPNGDSEVIEEEEENIDTDPFGAPYVDPDDETYNHCDDSYFHSPKTGDSTILEIVTYLLLLVICAGLLVYLIKTIRKI